MLYNGLFIAFGVLLLPHCFDGTGSWGRGKVNTSLQRSLMGFRFLSVGATSILGVPDLNEHIISCHICSSQYLKTCCKGSHWGPLDAEHTKRRSFLTAESYDEHPHPFSWNSPWDPSFTIHGRRQKGSCTYHILGNHEVLNITKVMPLFHCSIFVQDLHVMLLNPPKLFAIMGSYLLQC